MWKVFDTTQTNKLIGEVKRSTEGGLLDSEDDLNVEWDPFDHDIGTWNSEQLEEYLASSPDLVPSLKRIVSHQKNPYGGNSFFLCEMCVDDACTQVWIVGSILYHTPQYNETFVAYRAQHEVTP